MDVGQCHIVGHGFYAALRGSFDLVVWNDKKNQSTYDLEKQPFLLDMQVYKNDVFQYQCFVGDVGRIWSIYSASLVCCRLGVASTFLAHRHAGGGSGGACCSGSFDTRTQ